jgi:tetratricopeptide (TPR) repeat protein
LRRSIWSNDLQTVSGEIDTATQTALAIDSRDPWAHFVRGNMLSRLRRFDEGEREIRRALDLNPNFALAHAFYGGALNGLGRYQETIASAERALRLSPNDPAVGNFAYLMTIGACFGAGRYDDCVARARSIVEQFPQDMRGLFFLAAGLEMRGDHMAAQQTAAAVLRLRPEFSLAWITQNLPLVGNLSERLHEALRKAGIPEE